MSVEKNKEIAAEFFAEFWNKGSKDVVDELCAEDMRLHAPLVGDFKNSDEVKGFIGVLRGAIEGLSFEPTRPLIAEGDSVVCYWRATGVVREAVGYFAGNDSALDFTGSSLYTIVDGLIQEEFIEEDGMKALVQVGVLNLG